MHSLPSTNRLLAFAVLLPAAVAGSNQFLFDLLPFHQSLRPWLYPWMALTTAVLSWSVGRYLSPAWLRWLVFAWCLALLDLLTIAACLDHRVEPQFGFVLVSAQISLIALWAILAQVGWQWRLPGALIAASVLIAFIGFLPRGWRREWDIMMTITTVVVVLLSAGLRWRAFVLWRPPSSTPITRNDTVLAQHQFGLKHMLIWATAVVPLLLVLRGAEFWAFGYLGDMEAAFACGLVALSVATVNLIAIWSVLGRGLWAVRFLALLVSPPLIAMGITRYSAHIEAKYGRWPNVPILDALIDMQEHWFAWLWLNAALLAALLLFLRASGYRLLRKNI